MATDISIPEGYTLHTENTTHILIRSSKDAFLNPVQEFNRDLSVACIAVWSEMLNTEKEQKAAAKPSRMIEEHPRKRPKLNHPSEQGLLDLNQTATSTNDQQRSSSKLFNAGRCYRFTMLEPLSATGLRSIRYAKELPLLRYVVANDLSSSAVEAIERNVKANDVGSPHAKSRETGEEKEPPESPIEYNSGKVHISKGDACDLMYSHRSEGKHVDCIDLDPYGTVAPFIDAAVQAVTNGGLLCVTCTDLAVLATNNFPEKCFANYGGVPVKAEYCHEVALRLVLHMISIAASRYGRYISPLLSLSIDFYVRLFVRVRVGAAEVKKAFSNTGMVYVCSFCQTPSFQPLGRIAERTGKAGNVNLLYRQQQGPPCDAACSECGSPLHVSGPMWLSSIHDTEFVQRVLDHIESVGNTRYGTYPRMKGMVTLAKEEITAPFFFTAPKMASFFSCLSPPLEDVVSALINAGYEVSRSHASAGSIKTSAPRRVVHDIMRTWIKSHPVTMKNIAEDSPKRRLLSQEIKFEADFTRCSNSRLDAPFERLVRYQQNPAPNWGPATKAKEERRKK